MSYTGKCVTDSGIGTKESKAVHIPVEVVRNEETIMKTLSVKYIACRTLVLIIHIL